MEDALSMRLALIETSLMTLVKVQTELTNAMERQAQAIEALAASLEPRESEEEYRPTFLSDRG